MIQIKDEAFIWSPSPSDNFEYIIKPEFAVQNINPDLKSKKLLRLHHFINTIEGASPIEINMTPEEFIVFANYVQWIKAYLDGN